ncbi:MAG: hypothetical protein NZ518_03165 [Dehalococcoidia bacterium]|nr:hypothetical protein [Dehalococcoidia bacterium]
MAERSVQAENEERFRTDPDWRVREELLAWLIAPPDEAPGRERVPVALLVEQAVNESHWDLRPKIIRGLGVAAINNPGDREALMAALEKLLTDRTVHPNDKAVVQETLVKLQEAIAGA